jgi:hypothetical protein
LGRLADFERIDPDWLSDVLELGSTQPVHRTPGYKRLAAHLKTHAFRAHPLFAVTLT